MNELIFFFHIFCVVLSLIIATKLGKEALVTTICLQSILANFFLCKQITLFSFNTISTDIFAVGGLFGMNLLQEFYGKTIVRKTILINAFLLCFYLAMSAFQLWYTPNHFDQAHNAFMLILSIMPRITLASLRGRIDAEYPR